MPKTTDTPRYRQLANLFRDTITSGELAPGDSLPTEMEICETHSVSRHTARDALRILVEEGLIERRRGAGTVVAEASSPAFAQPIGDFESILQYARNARFELTYAGMADQEALDRTGLTGGYAQFVGLRHVGDKPAFAITAIYVRQDLAPTEEQMRQINGPVSEWLEHSHGQTVERVTQRMEAVALNADQARRLNVAAESPALRTIRRYRDAENNVVLLSESLHPAGRFAYEMRLDRTRP